MLKVHKYGGTSVGTVEKIKTIAKHLTELKNAGDQLVVVVSAMGKTTDHLVAKAAEITNNPSRRELDRLLSIGEQQTIALLTMALHENGVEAISMTGEQAGIKTEGMHTKSKIKEIHNDEIKKYLNDDHIVIVAGFQGINENGDITTLGRGGSDTSAVALAASLGCPCEIYTDVDGVYTVDPRVYPEAKKLDYITHDEMMEMSNLGAGVLEVRAVELAKKYGVSLYLGRTVSEIKGTYIIEVNENMEQKMVTGLSINDDTLMVNMQNVINKPATIAKIFTTLGDNNVNIDMISQCVMDENRLDISFTCPGEDKNLLNDALKDINGSIDEIKTDVKGDLIKVSLVGIGMMSHSGIAGKIFEIFAHNEIKFYQVTTSEISISYTIDKENKEKAVTALCKAFDL